MASNQPPALASSSTNPTSSCSARVGRTQPCASAWISVRAHPTPDAFVRHGDTVEVEGLQLRCIATPGHTPGSMSYYTDGLLFSGDTLFRGSIGRTDFPGGDYDQEMTSICERLLTLPDETIVLPGHMQESTVGYEKQHNPFVRDWLSRIREAEA